jgi:hypothetical protein
MTIDATEVTVPPQTIGSRPPVPMLQRVLAPELRERTL